MCKNITAFLTVSYIRMFILFFHIDVKHLTEIKSFITSLKKLLIATNIRLDYQVQVVFVNPYPFCNNYNIQ